jgi:hypothetical protein
VPVVQETGRSGRFVEEREISCSYRESNHDFSVSHPAARPCYAGETANQWKNARCLNLRWVRHVIFRFRRVCRLCLKTVLSDVWERACYLLFSCLPLWRGGGIMNWSTRAEWETRGRPCCLCFSHLTVDVAGSNFRSLPRTCSWRDVAHRQMCWRSITSKALPDVVTYLLISAWELCWIFWM